MKQIINNQLNNKFYTRVKVLLLSSVVLLAYGIFSYGIGGLNEAQATVPKYINFQGKLTKVSDGTNMVNGNYAFEFKLYDALTSGSLLWTETFDQPSGACGKLAVTNGVFNAKLGSCNSLSGIDFTGGSVYLSVNFAPTGTSYDGEMSPRKQLVSSAFALVANGVSGDGVINTAVQSSTALTVGRTGSNPALTVDTNTASSATGLKVTAAAAGGGLAITTISSGTDENLTVDAKGAGTISIGGTSTGNILLAGGSGSTGCTITNSNGNLTCTGSITGASTGTFGYWDRTGTVLSPATAGDDLELDSGDYLGLSSSIVRLVFNDAARDNITVTAGDLLFSADNTWDIGASGATRARTIYAGTSVVAPTINATTALQVGGADINTAGTLTNVAYLNQANTFTAGQTITPAVNTTGLAVSSYSLTGSDTHSLIDLSGTWNTSGTPTAIKLNITDTASGATSFFLDLQKAGSTVFSVNKNGSVSLNGTLSVGSTSIFAYGLRSRITSPADGQLLLQNAAQTDFGRLEFGGTTSSFPSIKRSGAGLQARLADDSGYTTFDASDYLLSGTSINTAGTLTNVAYKNQANTFTANNIFQPTVTTGTGSSAGVQISAGSLTSGNGLDISSSTLTSGNLVSISSNGTAAAASQTGLNISLQGTTATNAITSYGAQISNTHANATSGTNVALQLTASGATTANYALVTNGGSVGIGTTTPTSMLDVVTSSGSATESLFTVRSGSSTASNFSVRPYGANFGSDIAFNRTFNGTDDIRSNNAYSSFRIAHSPTGSPESLAFQSAPSGSGAISYTTALAISDTGRVGIGMVPAATYDKLQIQGSDGTGNGVALSIRNTDTSSLSFAMYKLNVGAGSDGGMFFGSSAALDAYGIANGMTLRAGTTSQDLGFSVGNNISGTGSGPNLIVKASGNVGIGDITPAALFTVGASDAFQVNSSGAIAAATGITSSGTINFSGLTASSAVYTDGSKNLTSTAPTSGTIGYWSRSGTTLQPATANDVVSISGNSGDIATIASSATGSANKALNVSQTGATGGTDYAGYFSNTGAATTNVGLYATATGATNNYAAIFDSGSVGIGTSAPGSPLEVNGTITVNTSSGVRMIRGQTSGTTNWFIDDNNGNSSGRLQLNVGSSPIITLSAAAAASVGKINITPTSTFSAAGVINMQVNAHTVTVSGSNPTTYATMFTDQLGAMTLVGTNAGQTITDAAALNIASAPIKSTNVALTNTHGLLISAGAVSTATNSYGLSVNAQTGASNNYAAQFMGGNVGIGDASPAALLTVGSGDLFQVNSSGAIAAVVGITNTGAQSTTVQSATALTVARTGTNYAFQVDTNTASSATGVKITSAAAAGGVAIAAISSGTDEALSIDAKGAGAINIGNNSTGSILFAGGVGSTGCTITTAGALSCSSTIGGSNLSGTNTGDQTITLTGDVTGSGTGSFATTIGSDKILESMLKAVDTASDEECLTYESTVGDFEWQSCGSALTPWTSNIDADGYALQDALNLEFRTAAGSAPAGTVIAVYADNSGDLTANVLTGKTFNVAVNGTDEYNFSSTALALNSNNITGVGTAITATAGLTVTGTAADLTLATATSGNVNLNSAGGTIELQDATNVTGALDVSTSLAVGTADAFQVASNGNVTSANAGTWTFSNDTDFTLSGGVNGLSFDGTTFSVDGSNNRIGIGIAAPTKSLDISLGGGSYEDNIRVINTNSSGIGAGMLFDHWVTGAGATASIARIYTASDGAAYGNQRLTLQSINSGGSLADTLTLKNGKVGINNTTPVDTLEVRGSWSTAGGLTLVNTAGSGNELNTILFYDSGYSSVSSAISHKLIAGATDTELEFFASTGSTMSQQMVIQGTGKVGIGTTAPDKPLEVNSATGAGIRITYNDGNGSAANYSDLSVSSGGDLTIAPSGSDTNITGNLIVSSLTSGGTQCVQASSTGVLSGTGSACGSGGGTTVGGSITSGIANRVLYENASNQLAESADFTYDGTTLGVSNSSTTASNKVINISQTGATSGTDYAGYFSNTGAATTNIAGYFTASGGTNNYAAIFDAGNVGVGTTTPNAKLNVYGAGSGSFGGFAALANFNTIDESTWNAVFTNDAAGPTSFTANFVDDSGNFWIGNDNVSYILQVATTGGVSVGLGYGDAPLSAFDVNGGVAIGTYAGNDAAPTNGLIVSGKVGIGTAAPEAPLHVSGANNFGAVSFLGGTYDIGVQMDPTYSTDTAHSGSYASQSLLRMTNSSQASAATFGGQASAIYNTGSATLPANTSLFGSIGSVLMAGTGSVPAAAGVAGFVIRQNTNTIDSASGGVFGFQNYVGSGTTGTVTGVTIAQPISTAGHTITNTFGIYIADQTNTAGTQTNTPYAIYQAGSSNYNYFAGNVGVGDASPNSLFTVGSGDLFQINSSGQIGSQQAPVSDYLFALAGTTGNDNSRIIDITQANNATEDSNVINIVNTANPGTISTAITRSIQNITSSLTPTATVNGASASLVLNVYGSDSSVSLGSVTVADVTGANSADIAASSMRGTLTFDPIINDTGSTGISTLLGYGTYSSVTGAPTLTSVTGPTSAGTYGGYFSNTASSAGNANLTYSAIGIQASALGDLTTTGSTEHYGALILSTGTADTNYGIYADVSGATNNYAAILTGGNVGIGDTSPAALFTVGSGDLFQVNSSGAIAAATGITSSGTITFSGLGGSGTKCVQTDNAGVITAAASACGSGSGITIGTTAITSGSSGRILYDNAGVVGEMTTSGSGTVVALATTPTFTTNITTPIVNGSTSADGTLTIQGNNTTGNTSTSANLVFKVGDSAGTTAMTILNNGNVGVGDSSPASLFTVGSGDLFQVNSSGQIGSQQAPVSDYLFALAGTTGNDNSRIIDITQANDSNENSQVINIANTVNTGTVSNTTRTISNITQTLTPTTTLTVSSSNSELDIYGQENTVSLANTTLGAVSSFNTSFIRAYADSQALTFSPTINDTSGSGIPIIYGSANKAVVTGAPTLTSLAGSVTMSARAGDFQTAVTSAGNANLTYDSYGVYSFAIGDLTTTGTTAHYGGYFNTSGTADTNYGIYAAVTGATTNYAGIFTGGNVGIGTATPTSLLHVQQSADSTSTTAPIALDINSVGSAGELTATSGLQTFARIAPIINQSSTAGYNALLINSTETALGSGMNRLVDLQVGGSTKFAVRNDGSLTLQDTAYITTPYGGFGKFQNLLVRSEEFDNASWIKTSVSAPTADAQVAPDGSSTAESLATSGSGGDVCQWSATAAGSNTFTFSVWVKAASGTQNFGLRVDAGATSCATANNVTGTEQTYTATTSWQRYEVTKTFSSATGNVKVRIFPGTTGSTGTVYAWGAQLDQASKATNYAYTAGSTLSNINYGRTTESNVAATASSTFTYGARNIMKVATGSDIDATYVADFIRVYDNDCSPDCDNTTKGLEVQAYSGTNLAGTNIGIDAYGYTFGVRATTTGQASNVAQPAAVFADLDNGSATTTGNAIRAYTDNATSADLVSLYQETSTYTGNGLELNFGNGGGSFTGNFISLQKGGTESFHVDDDGSTFVSFTGTGTGNAVCHSTNGNTTNDELVDCSSTPSADFAEMYPVDSDIEVGDIVVTGTQMVDTYDATSRGLVDWNVVKGKIAKLEKSTKGYQENIVGVVSDNYHDFTSTGYNIKPQDNPKSIALKGRVLVKVTDENGPIKAGDYITASSTIPGFGAKATRSGQVVGRALGDFTFDSTDTGLVMVFMQVGYQSIGNTIVLDAPNLNGSELQSGEKDLTSQNTSTFVIQQQAAGEGDEEAVANILQLQTGDQNRFMVSSTGSTSILSSLNCELDADSCPSVLNVTQANTELMNIDARGTLTLAGTIIIKDDSFAGSIVTQQDGIAEIMFTYHLGTGKPVVQLTVEAQIPVFAQIVEFKQDEHGNYIGFVIKTFDLLASPVQAIVHYNVTGKQEGYITFGDAIIPSMMAGPGDSPGIIIENGQMIIDDNGPDDPITPEDLIVNPEPPLSGADSTSSDQPLGNS